LTAVITGFYWHFGKVPFHDAFFTGALYTSIGLIGIGMMSFAGGGIVWQDVFTRATRRSERERIAEEGALLTPLGAALVVAAQVMLVSIAVARGTV